ncbi:MAG: hypothetical protein ACP5XB_16615, partial [Isosphaeraceae bacterium]
MARSLKYMATSFVIAWTIAFPCTRPGRGEETQERIPLRLSWGQRTPLPTSFTVRLAGAGVAIAESKGSGLEAGEGCRDGTWRTTAGANDVDGLEVILLTPRLEVKPREKLHPIWRDLIARSDKDTASRLRLDPGFRPDPRKLTVELDREGTRGFSVTIDQLLQSRSLWVPSLDVYLAIGDRAISFDEHQRELARWKGLRILDQVHRQAEASYGDFKSRWEDMGNPSYQHPRQSSPGHVVCLTWDSAVPKFGIDRGAGVWSDYGNPDRFHLWFKFGERDEDLRQVWRGQRLSDGLPVVLTSLEKDGIRCQVEQFAYPLSGPPRTRRGDIGMVLF